MSNGADTAVAIDATDAAIAYAKDHGVDLSKVTGTGKEGRITVMDVEKYFKELPEEEAEEEVQTEEKQVEEEKPAPKSAKLEPKPRAEVKAPPLPSLRSGLKDIYHIVRSIHELGMGWDTPVVTGDEADERLSIMMEEGWQIIHIQSLGVDSDGVRMVWVLGMPDEDAPVEREWPYREILHVVRRVGNMGDDMRGITGLQANEYISSYLQAGWDLALVEALDNVMGAVNMLWVLVR